MTSRLILRDWEAEAFHTGRLSAVVRLAKRVPETARRAEHLSKEQFQYWAGPKRAIIRCPLGAPGQRLWIAEGYYWYGYERSFHEVVYRSDRNGINFAWRSPATMPQWASRSTAVHLGSRLVRVQEVTEDEARACGVGEWQPCTMRWVSHDPPKDFAAQFIRDHGQAAWHANVWVWLHRIGRETK